MTHSSDSSVSLPTKQSVEHILNWFPEDYDFRTFQNYMYGSDQGQTFYYWMYSDDPSIIEIGRGGAINKFVEARPVRGEDYEWAIDVFESLDELLEIDFELTNNKDQANFRLYGTTGHNLNGSGGFADGTQLLNIGYTDIVVNVGELGSDLEESDPTNTYLALHEIGHALGLSHPGLPPIYETRKTMGVTGIRDIPLWDLYHSKDTIMSYNHHSSGPGQTYTEGDILALQTIWGEEGEYTPTSIIRSKKGKGKMKAGNGTTTFYFDKFEKFKNKNADKIINFDASRGDKIAFNELALPGLEDKITFTFATARSSRKLKSISKKGYDVIYFEKKGFLYADGNGAQKNWGAKDEGGLFAKIGKNTSLNIDDFIFYDV